MFFLTLKNPAVAWGQMAASQSRRHSHRVMPGARKRWGRFRQPYRITGLG